VQDVLAQAKRSPHHNGIEKGGLLESKLTPTSLRPKVCVSILASFYVWTKSLICKDAANKDSTV